MLLLKPKKCKKLINLLRKHRINKKRLKKKFTYLVLRTNKKKKIKK